MQSVSRRRVMHSRFPRLPMSLSMAQGGWILIGLSLLLPRGLPAAAADKALSEDLTEMSLEALMNIEVTSVSKKPKKQSAAAAAVFVISNDDLRRWRVTTIPDALRRVPGLQVARIDPSKWAISSRGFNGRFANKLLVMIDGRTVYTPLFAGVYWDMQEVMLDSRTSSASRSSAVPAARSGAPMP
jgi:iron complex outermembrane receptor protein